MHGVVLLDANDPLRPAIAWNDTRSVSEWDGLTARASRLRVCVGGV
ncbi:hypothetical protein [Paraburkholderia phytofirmans]